MAHVINPASRAQLAYRNGKLPPGWLEAGKFFPSVASGLSDELASSDACNSTPPPDGKIASAGQPFASTLDEVETDWQKHEVPSNNQLEIEWKFDIQCIVRRFNFFLTKDGWNPKQPLSRAQFETKPFYQDEYVAIPFWEHKGMLERKGVTHDTIRIPRRSPGHQVLLAVVETADTGSAYYEVVDLVYS